MLLYIYIQEATKIKIGYAFKESYIVDGAGDVSSISKHKNVLVYVRYK